MYFSTPKYDPNDDIKDSGSFEFKPSFTNNISNTGSTNVEIAVPLKHLKKEKSLINFEINIMLTWSENWVIFKADTVITFSITDTKHKAAGANEIRIQNNNKLEQTSNKSMNAGAKFVFRLLD